MTVFKSTVLAAAAALAVCVGAFAQEPDPAAFGPAIGDDLSGIIAGTDADCAPLSFADLTGGEGLVLYINRSVDWCPVCKAQVIEVDRNYDAFAAHGYAVAVLTTDGVEALARYAAERSPRLTLVSDEDSAVIGALGVLDPAFPEGHPNHGLPYPTTLVLSPEGVLEGKLIETTAFGAGDGFHRRITVDDVTQAIEANGEGS